MHCLQDPLFLDIPYSPAQKHCSTSAKAFLHGPKKPKERRISAQTAAFKPDATPANECRKSDSRNKLRRRNSTCTSELCVPPPSMKAATNAVDEEVGSGPEGSSKTDASHQLESGVEPRRESSELIDRLARMCQDWGSFGHLPPFRHSSQDAFAPGSRQQSSTAAADTPRANLLRPGSWTEQLARNQVTNPAAAQPEIPKSFDAEITAPVASPRAFTEDAAGVMSAAVRASLFPASHDQEDSAITAKGQRPALSQTPATEKKALGAGSAVPKGDTSLAASSPDGGQKLARPDLAEEEGASTGLAQASQAFPLRRLY